jgi:hypothetical protein
MRRKVNPSIVMLLWLFGFPLLLIVFSLVRGIGHSGGEQVPLSTFARGLPIYVLGSPIIIAACSIYFFSWFKRHFIVLTALFLFFGYWTYVYFSR